MLLFGGAKGNSGLASLISFWLENDDKIQKSFAQDLPISTRRGASLTDPGPTVDSWMRCATRHLWFPAGFLSCMLPARLATFVGFSILS